MNKERLFELSRKEKEELSDFLKDLQISFQIVKHTVPGTPLHEWHKGRIDYFLQRSGGEGNNSNC